MIFDSHTHTKFSADSEMRAEIAIMDASDKGVGLVFSDHYDPKFPGEQDFTFDKRAYFKEYHSYAGSKVHLGVEVGMREDTLAEVLAFVEDEPFDLVIGSLHIMEGKDLYEPSFYEGREKAELYHAYLTQMAQLVYSHAFVDVLGHIDYICRYAPFSIPDITYGDFAEDVDKVLRAAIETETTMELSTRRFERRTARKELFPIYKRYYDLGGRYVTLGSDAHTQDAIGAFFFEAEEFVKEAGLQIVTFCGHRLQIC